MRIKLILILFFVLGCKVTQNQKIESKKLFFAQLYNDWVFAREVKMGSATLLNSHQKVERPYNTWLLLGSMRSPDKNGKKGVESCLFYKVPFQKKNKLGTLKMISGKNCQNEFHKENEIQLGQIEWLRVYLSPEKEKTSEGEGIPPYHLAFQFKMKGKEKQVLEMIPLWNLGKGEIKYKGRSLKRRNLVSPKRYSGGVTKKSLTGINFNSNKIIDDLNEFPLSEDPVAQTEKKLSRSKVVLCHQVDENCQTVGEYTCDDCEKGWYEVLGGKCSRVHNKVCGVNKCGTRGNPACVRGMEFEARIPRGCRTGSRAGFCNPGLDIICNEDNVLTCI